MKLDDYCVVKYGLSEADFWIYARGSEKSLGQPTKDSENIAKKAASFLLSSISVSDFVNT
jgi:hypothetical protein